MIDLKRKIISKQAVVCVVGLGYVGYPLLKLISKKGYKIIGLDNDKSKIKKLNSKKIKMFFFQTIILV